MTEWSRRPLIAGAAGLGWPGLRWLSSGRAQDRAWIPSDRFLADLPRIRELASILAAGLWG
jgi:hypothetical protein